MSGNWYLYLHGTSLTKLPLKACKPSWVTGISICYKSHQNIAESVQATYLLSHGIRRISPPSAVSEELIQLQNLHTQKVSPTCRCCSLAEASPICRCSVNRLSPTKESCKYSMQFLHCAVLLPLIAIYRELATWQASPICRLSLSCLPPLKELCNCSQTISTLSCTPSFTCKYARYQSHLCLAKSHQIAVAMSPCQKQLISEKSLTALMFRVIIYPPTQEFYPHR
jgi:hypothetical protein